MTTIAILGAGRVSARLADKLVEAGHNVIIGARNSAETWAGPPVLRTEMVRAAEAAEIIIHATPGDGAVERLSALGPALAGKILIDVANATGRDSAGLPNGLLYPESSLAEHIQQALPHTRVVKTLNTMLFTVMTAPESLTIPPTAFLSGNDTAAKQVVAELLGDLGWVNEWIEDLGDITTARGTEALVLLVPSILRNHGLKPFALTIAG